MARSAISSAVQPSLEWTDRTGRGWLNRKISFLRTAKICPVTSTERSLIRKQAIGATLAGVISLIFSTRAFCSGVSVLIDEIIRLQAKGAIQFDRTFQRLRSSATDLEKAAIPSLAAA
jgi:hypothetical protein